MDLIRKNLILGKPLYSITETGFIVIYNSKYDYASNAGIMQLIIKYGKVILDDEFNAPIPFIVNGVRVLICGKQFNHPLDNLPSSLRVLQIGAVRDRFYCEFSKSITNLPHGLEDLRLFALKRNDVIPRDLGNYLPSTIKYLYMNVDWTIDINLLPDSIEELYIKQNHIILENVARIPAN